LNSLGQTGSRAPWLVQLLNPSWSMVAIISCSRLCVRDASDPCPGRARDRWPARAEGLPNVQ
jgi:hypothetical protein